MRLTRAFYILQGTTPKAALSVANQLSPGSLIRAVRETSTLNVMSLPGKEADPFVDPSAEISDIDRRLNQLQDFLRQAKQGAASSGL
jgi:hypothetical protein